MARFLKDWAADKGVYRGAELFRQGLTAELRADRLSRCGSYLCFRHYLEIDEVRLHEAYFCQQDKLCPFCAIRRGAKFLRRYSERIVALILERPELRPYLVTTTVENGPELLERFEHHRGALRRLIKWRKHYLDGYSARWTEACVAAGGVGSYEFKRGSGSGMWHPHNHAVWLCERAPDQDKLRAEWHELTGDSHIVDVRPFHYVRAGLRATVDNVARDCVEVFKYALKFSSMTVEDNWHAFELTHGRRLIEAFGDLRGVQVPECLADEDLDLEDFTFVELFFRYTEGGYVQDGGGAGAG